MWGIIEPEISLEVKWFGVFGGYCNTKNGPSLHRVWQKMEKLLNSFGNRN